VENYYVKQEMGSGGGNRRQKYSELKSIQERKRDQEQVDTWSGVSRGKGRAGS
jgi:hypothetical protein